MAEYNDNHEEQLQGPEEDGSDLTSMLAANGDETFVTGEPKKPVNKTSLLIFGVLVVGLGGYWLMSSRTGPQTAGAAVTAGGAASQADETISQFLSAGDENLKVMRQMRQTTDKVVAQFRTSTVTQVPVEALQTNPFRYADEKNVDPNAAAEAEKRRQEEERQACLRSAQELQGQLQSIMAGGTRQSCMIANHLYKVGESVQGFTIERITARGVVVKQGTHRFEIKMQK